MLYVHWSGFNNSDTVVVLSRDIFPNSRSTSYLYVSNNYGKSYLNQSSKLEYKRGGVTSRAVIEVFYASPVKKKWVSLKKIIEVSEHYTIHDTQSVLGVLFVSSLIVKKPGYFA